MSKRLDRQRASQGKVFRGGRLVDKEQWDKDHPKTVEENVAWLVGKTYEEIVSELSIPIADKSVIVIDNASKVWQSLQEAELAKLGIPISPARKAFQNL